MEHLSAFSLLEALLNIVVGTLVFYLGMTLFKKFGWWIDICFAIVGIAWAGQYIWIVSADLTPLELAFYGPVYARTTILFTQLFILGNLYERLKDCK
jgi:hypothetical protein